MGHAKLFPLLSLLPLLAACSFTENRTAMIGLPKGGLPTRTPNGRLAYDCYAVSITGPGVSPTASDQELGTYSADCLRWGIYSNMVSEATMTDGVSIKLPAGVQRDVTVYGIVTKALGAKCEGQPATALFANQAIPELYPLAASENVNLLKDTKIELKRTTPLNSETNILDGCFQKDPGNEISSSAVKQVRLAAIFNASNGLALVDLNLDTGVLAIKEQLSYLFPSTYMLRASPDSKRLIAWDTGAGNHKQFLYSQDALTYRPDTYAGSAFSSKFDGLYSANSSRAYFTGTNHVLFGAANPNEYAPTNQLTGALTTGLRNFVRGNFIYVLMASHLEVNYAALPSEWAAALPFLPAGINVNAVEPSPSFLVIGTGVFFLFKAGTNQILVQYAEFQPDGKLQLLGNPTEVGNDGALNNYELAWAPNERVLVIKINTGAAAQLNLHPVTSSWQVQSAGTTTTGAPDFRSMFMDPSARFLIIGSVISGVASQIASYRVTTATGIVGLEQVGTLNTGLPNQMVAVVPLATR